MYKFQKVQLNWKSIQIDYDWMLVIESMKDLMDYHENVMKVQIPRAWKNLEEVQAHKAHLDNNLSLIINLIAQHEDNKSLLELSGIASGKIFEAKASGILRDGKIYVNKNGGFFSHNKDLTILDEIIIDSDRLIFPQYTEKDIRVKRWDDGTHWYAYVGDFQVEWDGDKKWNSEETATRAAKCYLYRTHNEQFKIKE
jgi:hypothetical protein